MSKYSLITYCILVVGVVSCTNKSNIPSSELIKEINLKRGEMIYCGPPDGKYGTAEFKISEDGKVQEDFNLAVKMLHSFEYDEAEKVFAKIIDDEPGCAMAYWGVAMSNFHPLWTPPSESELKKGAKAIEIAKSIDKKSKREEEYINAINTFYQDYDKLDHRTRCLKFEKAMEDLHSHYPDDIESGTFYALALTAAADPADKTFARQKKAGEILNKLYPGQPDHPGIVHYIIHAYDSPELAALALSAARKYASVAPSSAHALHMPSHIFTRLGLWDECIESNLASVASAKCYAEQAGIKGHWDEELHALDYLMYGYLQKGDNVNAKKQLEYLNNIKDVTPFNFKVTYAFASIPSRYFLENKLWHGAAKVEIKESIKWEDHPWQKATLHFTRVLGLANIGNLDAAKAELKNLINIHSLLTQQKDNYKANQVQIQIHSAEGWIMFKEGKHSEALSHMNIAAEMEDKTEKHPVTPGSVRPAGELLADMLLEMNKPGEALIAYELTLKKLPGRFNALYGAGVAAEKAGNVEKAKFYYKQVSLLANSNRPEVVTANTFLKNQTL